MQIVDCRVETKNRNRMFYSPLLDVESRLKVAVARVSNVCLILVFIICLERFTRATLIFQPFVNGIRLSKHIRGLFVSCHSKSRTGDLKPMPCKICVGNRILRMPLFFYSWLLALLWFLVINYNERGLMIFHGRTLTPAKTFSC